MHADEEAAVANQCEALFLECGTVGHRVPGARRLCGEVGAEAAQEFLVFGVSQKMLTQTLRSLERDGLLTRTVTPTVPVTVTYELTDLGLSLHSVIRGIKAWAEAHMDEVLANRNTYDTRVG
ncbi:winged helix-turn-helix transcriptional regulator [Rhodococcus opacus]|uniref:winged helix-turn-helix transcriptional regulator n=1 Tax=Rhodococcus opacus TaxID=37919 RepID=UPI003CD04441